MPLKKVSEDSKKKRLEKDPRKTGIKRKVMTRENLEVSRFANYLAQEQEVHLRRLARSLMEPGQGILAADDSVNSIDKCLRSVKLSATDSNRIRYFDVLLGTCKQLCQFVSGFLVREELSKLKFQKGRSLAYLLLEADIHLGIRVDKTFIKLPGTLGEWATLGLDSLTEDCKRFKERGVTFVLCRCVYKVTWCTPSSLALTVNSNTLAGFAAVSQTAGLVPILSVELLPEGDYDLELAKCALKDILTSLMKTLYDRHVYLEGLIIRLTPAFPGTGYQEGYEFKDVIQSTLQICNGSIPDAVGGIMLARRDTLAESTEVMNELNKYPMRKPQPISFCYSRVIHDDVIKMWAGNDANLEKAKNALMERAKVTNHENIRFYRHYY